jgi:predicted phage tail protein
MVFFGASAGSALLAAMCFFIHGRPCPPFGLLLANASGFVAFLDVLGLSLLLTGVAGFVSAWHHDLLWQISIS